MAKYPIYAALPKLSGENDKLQRLTRLRDTILQSAGAVKFRGWNKKNFLRAIENRSAKRLTFLVIEAEADTRTEEFIVPLSSGQSIKLEHIIEKCSHTGPLNEWRACIIFIHLRPHSINLTDISYIYRHREKYHHNPFLIFISRDTDLFAFALVCEACQFWELKSCKNETVKYSDIFNVMYYILKDYREITSIERFDFATFRNFSKFTDPAWSGGKLFAKDVDIEKISKRARLEQRSDTIKRMLDAASHPRFQHTKSNERMISTQALFWLGEINEEIDVHHWLEDTQFFREVAPIFKSSLVPAVQLTARNVGQEATRDFIAKLVKVPGGRYRVGTVEPNVDSEPPVQSIEVEIENFEILCGSVTEGLWNTFVSNFRESGHTDNPIININFFEAAAFANIVESRINEIFGSKFRVALPTEYQWEIAARGSDGRSYPWGDEFKENACNCEMIVGHPTAVGSYSPQGDSPFGCRDMAGNVREWTCSYAGTRGVDWQLLYSTLANRERTPIQASSRLVIRGGSYSYDKECVQTWLRNTQIASRRDRQTGFRLVLMR